MKEITPSAADGGRPQVQDGARPVGLTGIAALEAEMRDRLAAKDRDLAQWTTWGVIEIAIRNPNVNSFVTEKEAEIERFRVQHDKLVEALRAAKGYLLNARIDLETGAPKKTAINTIEGGLRMIDAVLSSLPEKE